MLHIFAKNKRRNSLVVLLPKIDKSVENEGCG